MIAPSETAHAEHVAQSQYHLRWRHDHLESLSILNRVEATFLACQVVETHLEGAA